MMVIMIVKDGHNDGYWWSMSRLMVVTIDSMNDVIIDYEHDNDNSD